VGTIVSVTGTYATPGGSVVIRWNSLDIETITAELDGTYSYDLPVPASVTGDHTVTVEDVESTNTATETFTVEPQIILTPEDGLVGDSVTVTGTGFSGASLVDVYFDIDKDGVPDAEELMLDDVPTDEFGSFSSSFTVPWVTTAGNYMVRAVDAQDVTDDATFTVLFVMYTRSGEYLQGDYPSFFIDAADETGDPMEGVEVIVSVYDPAGYLQYKGITVTIDDGTVPYDIQFFNWLIFEYGEALELTPLHLPSDATVGTWMWAATVDGLTINGSFEVIEPVDLRTLLDMLDQLLDGQNDIAGLISYYGDKLQLEHDELAQLIAATSNELQLDHEEIINLINEVGTKLELGHEDLADLVESVFAALEIKLDNIDSSMVGIEEKVDGLYLVIGDLDVKLDDIDAKLTNIQGDIATIDTTLGTIQVDVENIDAEIVDIKDDLAIIKTDIGTIEVKLDNIQAKLVDIQGDLATITTTLGEIETKIDNLGAVSLEEIKGDVATIKSDIGTIKVNVNNIDANVTSIKGRLVTIETTLGPIQIDIDDINGRIEAIEGDMARIQTDIGPIEISLTDIKTKIEVTTGNVATIQTDVGTIKGRLTSVEGDMATVETDIGTIKTSTSNIQTTGESIKSDTSLQVPVIALSLIAAIAAIAAAAMVLRKVYMK
jgi:chromosome segregation ATPase